MSADTQLLREVFGKAAPQPWSGMTGEQFFDCLLQIAMLSAKRIQDMQNQIDRLERDVAALEGRSE